MRPSLSSRAQAVLLLALAATLGALLGILGDRLLASRRTADEPQIVQGPPPRSGVVAGMRYTQGLAERLDLTAAQRAQIDTILAEEQVRARALTRQFQPQFREVARQTRERVEAVLTPEQRDQLREMRQQRMRRGDGQRPRREGGRPPSDDRPL